MVVNDHTSCVIRTLKDSALTINGFNARFLYIPLRLNLEPCLESSESAQGPEERDIGRGYVLNVSPCQYNSYLCPTFIYRMGNMPLIIIY